MLKLLNKVIPYIRTLLKVLLVTIGSAMLLIAWVHIFYRFVLNNSLSWSEELLKVLLVWFCLFSTSVIAVQREHVSIVIFKEKLPKEFNQLLTLTSQVFIYLTSLMVTYIGFRMVISAWNRTTPAARIPYPLVYGAIPVAFIIISIYELRNLLEDTKNYKAGIEIGSTKE